MATYGGSSNVSSGYAVRPRSSLSTHESTNSSPMETSPVETLPVETSPLEGPVDAPIYRFTRVPDLRKRVRSQSDALIAGRTTQQYLVFRGATEEYRAQIDRQRASIGKHTRMTHYTDTDLLVIKLMPSAGHHATYIALADEVSHKLDGMGPPRQSLYGLGKTTCFGPNSSKEGDSIYKPKCRPHEDDWPTIAFEAGLSESLSRLRTDARWWLINSGGEVKIAIIISIMKVEKSLRIEQWCSSQPLPLPTRPRPATRAATRAYSNANTSVPTRIQELTVIQDPPIPALPGTIPTYTVTGAPLTLEFEKLLLRVPVLPEGNVILTAADLQARAEEFWSMVM